MYDELCRLYLFCDRIGERVMVPKEELKALIVQAAKIDGQEQARFPWEAGKDYEERMRECSAQTV